MKEHKRSARSDWEQFVQSPENRTIFESYGETALDPTPLFEAIGERLASPHEELRLQAYWALLVAMPELADILHERESRRPGWRSGPEDDPRMVNQGVDILRHLYNTFVRDYKFKSEPGSQDPRPYVRTIARRWQNDESRKNGRLVSLEDMVRPGQVEPEFPSIYDSLDSPEQEALDRVSIAEWQKELRAWGFLDEKELALFGAIYGDDRPLQKILQDFCRTHGVPSQPAARQMLCRARKKAVHWRDSILSQFLTIEAKRSDEFENYMSKVGWTERAVQSIDPGPWNKGTPDGRILSTARPLTRGFSGAPGHLWLAAWHKRHKPDLMEEITGEYHESIGPRMEIAGTYRDYLNMSVKLDTLAYEYYDLCGETLPPPREDIFFPLTDIQGPLTVDTFFALQIARYLQDMAEQYNGFVACFLDSSHETDIPGLNTALREVGSDYYCILLNHSWSYYKRPDGS